MKIYFLLFFLIFNKLYAQEGGKVDEQLLKAIVNIKVNKSSGTGISGTGFIVGTLIGKDRQRFLVTNKHMIGLWSMVDSFIPAKEIIVTIYSNDKNIPFFNLKIPISDSTGKLNKNVIVHNDPSVDVACIYLNDFLKGVEKAGFTTIDTRLLTPLDSIKKTTFIGLGSQVFAVGYPDGVMITKSNEPIVKSGYLASSFSGDLEMKEQWKNKFDKNISVINRTKYFLVDGLIIPGNSGGPVLSPIITLFYENGLLMSQTPPIRNRIIGIVSYIRQNTGICTVYAADYILELIRKQIENKKND